MKDRKGEEFQKQPATALTSAAVNRQYFRLPFLLKFFGKLVHSYTKRADRLYLIKRYDTGWCL